MGPEADGTGLFDRLEVGPQSRVAVVDIRDPLFVKALRERTAGVAEGRVPPGAPTVFFGAETREALGKVQLLRARMIDSGALWIVRPKVSKAISDAELADSVKSNGLVETKVVAFSRTHTAHKCVVPLELQGQMRRRPPILSIPPPAPLVKNAQQSGQKKSLSVRPAKPVKAATAKASAKAKSAPERKAGASKKGIKK